MISLASLFKEGESLGNHDPVFIALGMCGQLLFELFGREWMSTKILTPQNFPSILMDSVLSNEECDMQNRLLTLGENIYNLREIEGIDVLLNKLYRDSVDPIIAELESGRLLYHRGLNFKFVSQSGKKREDFDIRVTNGSLEIFCESKSKKASTNFTEATFINSLHSAKKQLPTQKPGMILIKIPSSWSSYDTQLKIIAKAMVDKTNRPLGIVCWHDKSKSLDKDQTIKYTSGFETHNIQSEVCNSVILPILPNSIHTSNWVQFQKFASGLL